ncbi:amidase [Bacillus sp. BGMRC 2118]|nr:amidase [Bacillus sp. BGMRC 2118]
MNVTTLSIEQLATLYRRRELSPVEVVKEVLLIQEKIDSRLNSFITVEKESAIQSAKLAEKAFKEGEDCHQLTGIPYSVKDLFYTKDIRTTCGSHLLRDFVPAYTASVVERLQSTGAVLLGKNNMLEFAYGIVHPEFGQTNNPHDVSKTAGGSSGGSAAAVAAGIGCFSLGTDTGGSIRIPASYCGTVGLKPTYGLVSDHGVFPLSWSLDHVGPLTRTVKDAAIVLNVMAGLEIKLTESLDRKTVGVLPQSKLTSLQPEVRNIYDQTVNLINSMGWEVVEIDIEKWNLAEDILMNILLPEAAYIHERWLNQKELYAPMTYAQLQQGLTVSALDYITGTKAQKEFTAIVTNALAHVDVLLTPTVAFPAPSEDPVIGDNTQNEMTFTGPFNVSGHPALTLNMGYTQDQLPVGMQLIGKHHGEQELLNIAYMLELRGNGGV